MSQELPASAYARRRKEILALLKKLEGFGAQADLDLPRIAVIGNQSAGKSSVIEGISGINVPRDPGAACTRTPMECRMTTSASPSAPWTAQISIRREYDDYLRHPLSQVTEVPFGKSITNPAELEFALRRAQFSILNPSVPPERILSATSVAELDQISSAQSLTFSRNVVCVDLEGPDLTDLSFIDLPGLVQNAEPQVVQLVEDMANSYIRGNSIILVVITMVDDIENQKALRLAHDKDPEGHRTIGVLTKPDMLVSATAASNLWLQVLEGHRHQLLHGYYCTRQPNDNERRAGITHSRAKEVEEAFFAETIPWATSSEPQRFGTGNLVSSLSRLLVQVLNDKLPEIRSKTAHQLQRTNEQLAALPSPIPANQPAQAYLLSLLVEYCIDVQTFIEGGAGKAELIHANLGAYKELKEGVRATKPWFIPLSSHEGREVRSMGMEIKDLNEEQEEEQEDRDGDNASNENEVRIGGAARPSMDLSDMKKHIGQSITRELPNNVPFTAKVALITQFQRTWPVLVKTCLDRVQEALEKLLLDKMIAHFGRFNVLQGNLRSYIKQLVRSQRQATQHFLDGILEAEYSSPFTQNTVFFKRITDNWVERYRVLREQSLKSIGELGQAQRVSSTPANFTFNVNGTGNAARGTDNSNNTERPSNPARGTNNSGNTEWTSNPLFNFSSPARTTNPNPTPSSTPAASSTSGAGFGPNSSPFVALANTNNAKASSQPRAFLPFPIAAQGPGPFSNNESTRTEANSTTIRNEYETEIMVMAEVRAYFQLACMRIIDTIPGLIDLKFVRAVGKSLQPFLVDRFEIGHDMPGSAATSVAQNGTPTETDKFRSLLAENPGLVARRDDLLARRRRLERAEAELDEF